MHLCSSRSELERLLRTGEPCAVKAASTVRGGAAGQRTGLETVGNVFRQVESIKQHRAGRLLYREA
jgi:hypothetical protein